MKKLNNFYFEKEELSEECVEENHPSIHPKVWIDGQVTWTHTYTEPSDIVCPLCGEDEFVLIVIEEAPDLQLFRVRSGAWCMSCGINILTPETRWVNYSLKKQTEKPKKAI